MLLTYLLFACFILNFCFLYIYDQEKTKKKIYLIKYGFENSNLNAEISSKEENKKPCYFQKRFLLKLYLNKIIKVKEEYEKKNSDIIKYFHFRLLLSSESKFKEYFLDRVKELIEFLIDFFYSNGEKKFSVGLSVYIEVIEEKKRLEQDESLGLVFEMFNNEDEETFATDVSNEYFFSKVFPFVLDYTIDIFQTSDKLMDGILAKIEHHLLNTKTSKEIILHENLNSYNGYFDMYDLNCLSKWIGDNILGKENLDFGNQEIEIVALYDLFFLISKADKLKTLKEIKKEVISTVFDKINQMYKKNNTSVEKISIDEDYPKIKYIIACNYTEKHIEIVLKTISDLNQSKFDDNLKIHELKGFVTKNIDDWKSKNNQITLNINEKEVKIELEFVEFEDYMNLIETDKKTCDSTTKEAIDNQNHITLNSSFRETLPDSNLNKKKKSNYNNKKVKNLKKYMKMRENSDIRNQKIKKYFLMQSIKNIYNFIFSDLVKYHVIPVSILDQILNPLNKIGYNDKVIQGNTNNIISSTNNVEKTKNESKNNNKIRTSTNSGGKIVKAEDIDIKDKHKMGTNTVVSLINVETNQSAKNSLVKPETEHENLVKQQIQNSQDFIVDKNKEKPINTTKRSKRNTTKSIFINSNDSKTKKRSEESIKILDPDNDSLSVYQSNNSQDYEACTSQKELANSKNNDNTEPTSINLNDSETKTRGKEYSKKLESDNDRHSVQHSNNLQDMKDLIKQESNGETKMIDKKTIEPEVNKFLDKFNRPREQKSKEKTNITNEKIVELQVNDSKDILNNTREQKLTGKNDLINKIANSKVDNSQDVENNTEKQELTEKTKTTNENTVKLEVNNSKGLLNNTRDQKLTGKNDVINKIANSKVENSQVVENNTEKQELTKKTKTTNENTVKLEVKDSKDILNNTREQKLTGKNDLINKIANSKVENSRVMENNTVKQELTEKTNKTNENTVKLKVNDSKDILTNKKEQKSIEKKDVINKIANSVVDHSQDVENNTEKQGLTEKTKTTNESTNELEVKDSKDIVNNTREQESIMETKMIDKKTIEPEVNKFIDVFNRLGEQKSTETTNTSNKDTSEHIFNSAQDTLNFEKGKSVKMKYTISKGSSPEKQIEPEKIASSTQFITKENDSKKKNDVLDSNSTDQNTSNNLSSQADNNILLGDKSVISRNQDSNIENNNKYKKKVSFDFSGRKTDEKPTLNPINNAASSMLVQENQSKEFTYKKTNWKKFGEASKKSKSSNPGSTISDASIGSENNKKKLEIPENFKNENNNSTISGKNSIQLIPDKFNMRLSSTSCTGSSVSGQQLFLILNKDKSVQLSDQQTKQNSEITGSPPFNIRDATEKGPESSKKPQTSLPGRSSISSTKKYSEIVKLDSSTLHRANTTNYNKYGLDVFPVITQNDEIGKPLCPEEEASLNQILSNYQSSYNSSDRSYKKHYCRQDKQQPTCVSVNEGHTVPKDVNVPSNSRENEQLETSSSHKVIPEQKTESLKIGEENNDNASCRNEKKDEEVSKNLSDTEITIYRFPNINFVDDLQNIYLKICKIIEEKDKCPNKKFFTIGDFLENIYELYLNDINELILT